MAHCGDQVGEPAGLGRLCGGERGRVPAGGGCLDDQRVDAGCSGQARFFGRGDALQNGAPGGAESADDGAVRDAESEGRPRDGSGGEQVRGRRPDELRAIADATHRALVDVLRIPERDRFQLITEHDADHVIALDAGLGFARTDRLVLIQIFTQSGRTTEVKQRVFRAVAEQLEHLGIGGEDVFVSIVENGPQDWSFGFGRAQYTEGALPVPGR